jgi:hypothetical protein
LLRSCQPMLNWAGVSRSRISAESASVQQFSRVGNAVNSA